MAMEKKSGETREYGDSEGDGYFPDVRSFGFGYYDVLSH